MKAFGLAVVAMIDGGCAWHKPADCCNPVMAPAGAPQFVAVVDSLEPIKAAFNAGADKPRVVLLVSPVCSECVFGAEVVRRSIMDCFAGKGVHAIVVWEPMLEPDNEAAARHSSGIFAGTDAVQFYDPERHAGWAYERDPFSRKWDEVEAALPADHWLRETVDRRPDPGPEWDLYMLYRPGVRWEDRPPKPDAFIRHIGRDEQGQSRYFRDGFNAPPATGDLYEAMERMGCDVLGPPQTTKIELLGFPNCPNTPEMRQNLRAALRSIGSGLTFDDVNQEALAAADIRRHWPAPTVLVNGADLFGMAPPVAPSMGCRLYAGGVPTAKSIAEGLRTSVSNREGSRR
jgi:hypothetical protein